MAVCIGVWRGETVPREPPDKIYCSHTDAVYHNRAVSVAILPITIAPFAAGSLNPTLDGLFIGLILIHTHIGFEYA